MNLEVELKHELRVLNGTSEFIILLELWVRCGINKFLIGIKHELRL
jgi:hypothetical protein